MASKQSQQSGESAPSRAAGGQPHAPSATLSDQRNQSNQPDQYTYDARTLHALQALTDTALSHLSLETLLPELLERARAVMQVDNVAVLVLDEDAQELEISAARGLEEEAVGQVRIPVGVGFAGQIAATRAPLAVANLSTYPVSNPLLRDRLRSALGVPLLAGERVLGVVHIGTTTPHRFTPGEQALLEQVADRIARAVERAQLFKSEHEARLAAQRQANLINLSFEPIFAWSAQGGIVEWNAGAEQLYGYTRAEALGRISHDLLRTVHPIPLKMLLAVLERDGRWTGELRQTTRDGREVLVESRQQIVDLDEQRLILETNRDVTERWALNEALKRRTRELEDANVQLRTLLDVLPVGVAIVDATGRPVLVNDAVRQIWGQNLLVSASTADYGEYRAWRTDTGEAVAAGDWGLARALAHGEVTVGKEYDIEAFDGQRKTILDSATPLRDESGTITGAVSVIFDITDRRQLERRTREALEAFIAITRTLVEAPDEEEVVGGALASGGDGTGYTGVAADPGAVQSMDELARRVWPEAESRLARRLAELTQGILGCSRVSITAVEGEHLLARPVTVVGLSPEQERQWWAEQEAHSPQVAGEGLIPEDRARLLAGETLTLDLTRPPYQIPNAYGVTSVLVAPMRTQGRLVGMLALDFLDPGQRPHIYTPEQVQIAEAVARLGAVVLERERLLREREEALAEALALAEANRRMDEFLSIAGHELRTPVTTIKMNLQMAERRMQQAREAYAHAAAGEPHEQGHSQQQARRLLEQLMHLLERAARSAERQERLVLDLLDISRISSGRLEYRMAPQDLTAVLREAVEEQRLSTSARRIQLNTPGGQVPVIADADRLVQVLTNYLNNALKYSEGDRPVIVTLRALGTTARLEVRDQGPGLSPEQQRHLFERFHRVPGIEVVSGSVVGLGLGLYISKAIVERHGGQVGVESAPGEGSTFWFTLPLADSSGELG